MMFTYINLEEKIPHTTFNVQQDVMYIKGIY